MMRLTALSVAGVQVRWFSLAKPRFTTGCFLPSLWLAIRRDDLVMLGWSKKRCRIRPYFTTGWPVGLIESAASGCVPVVRDWPQVAALGGARGIYRDTPAWVTSTPAQAAARIVEFADVGTWVRESARSREAAVALCAVGTTTNEYLDVILGASRAVDAPL